MAPGKKELGCSVVITVKNDAEALERTLRALLRQTRQPEEILLTVADSQDNTLAVAQTFAQEQRFIQVVCLGSATRSQGRNLGVEASTQDCIVFTDAGCVPDKNWLAELLAPFEKAETVLVAGLTKVDNTSSFAEAQGAFVLVPPEKIGNHPLPATRNMAVRKNLFLQHSGFRADLNFAEDYELARRLQTAGIRSVFAPKAIVAWEARSSLAAYFSMILHLTQGDIQAGTWRRGHATMWLRYLGLLALGVTAVALTTSLLAAAFLTSTLYLAYLVFKLTRFQFSRLASYFWAILLQVLTDMAVLLGSLQGLGYRYGNRSL